jgi:hypothetical protein
VAHFGKLLKIVISVPSGDHDPVVSFWEGALGQPLPQFDYPEYHGAAPPGELHDGNAHRWP